MNITTADIATHIVIADGQWRIAPGAPFRIVEADGADYTIPVFDDDDIVDIVTEFHTDIVEADAFRNGRHQGMCEHEFGWCTCIVTDVTVIPA